MTLIRKDSLEKLREIQKISKSTDVGYKVKDVYKNINNVIVKNTLDGYVDNWEDFVKKERKRVNKLNKSLKTFESFSKDFKDIMITIPKDIKWETYKKELIAAENGEILNFKVKHFPKTSKGCKCYIIHDGKVKGYMIISGLKEKSFKCSTTGKEWEGKFVERTGKFYNIEEYDMTGFRGFKYLVNESLNLDDLYRNNKNKIDLSQVKYIYHWMTEGKFFEACYGDVKQLIKYIVDRTEDKIFEMPSQLPPINYTFGGDDYTEYKKCLTVDPTYIDPCFNEDGSCIVLDFQKLRNDYDFEDLTDKGEAEIRTIVIDNWTKYLIRIDIPIESYNNGIEWEEEVTYRAIKLWLPEELKSKVKTFKSEKDLINRRKTTDV